MTWRDEGRPGIAGRLRRPILWGSAITFTGGALLSLAYWVISLEKFAGAALSPLAGAVEILPGLLVSKLRWASRDASTLTPIIALLFCGYTAAGSWRALFPGEEEERLVGVVKRRSRSYPFPPSYQVTWVQLGLLGTLFSFLLLGGRLKTDLAPEDSVSILVIAFGTALLSTFAGVVGGFLLGPATVALFHGLVVQEILPDEGTVESVDALKRGLVELGTSAKKTSRILGDVGEEGSDESLARSAERAQEALKSLREELSKGAVEEWMTGLAEKVVKSMTDEQDRRLRRLEDSTYANLILLGSTMGQGLAQLGQGVQSAQQALTRDLVEEVERGRKALSQEAKQDREAFAKGVHRLGGEIVTFQERLEEGLKRKQRFWVRRFGKATEQMTGELKKVLLDPPADRQASRGWFRRWWGRP